MRISPSFYILLFFVCLGLGFSYAIGLLSRSIWYDEAITLQSLAAIPFGGAAPGPFLTGDLATYLDGVGTVQNVLQHYRTMDVHPPLYFLVAHGVTLVFGNSLIVVRAVSLALVLISVAIYGRWLSRSGHPDPWVYTLVYGLSFAAVTTAQDARSYAMTLLLAVAAWHVLAVVPDWRGRRRLGGEVLLGLLCGGLLLTHYFAALLVAGLLSWHVLHAARQRSTIALVAPIIAVLAFLPWAPVFVQHLSARPDQMAGFLGLAEWIKRSANLAGGQVLSATSFAVPSGLQKMARLAVLALIAIGVLSVLSRPGDDPARARMARIAVVVPAIGMSGFLVASLVLDRWFAALRYFLFFAPFLAYLAARGAMVLGRALTRIGPAAARRGPAGALVLAQVAMLNFGWEANANRGGAYYETIAAFVRDRTPDETLVIVDPGSGRGTLLSAAHALPPSTRAYLLSPSQEDWESQAPELSAALDGTREVFLVFTIDRGSMESDKTLIYGPIIDMLDAFGFVRAYAPPAGQGQRFYARWTS